jgi:hypothetical protein
MKHGLSSLPVATRDGSEFRLQPAERSLPWGCRNDGDPVRRSASHRLKAELRTWFAHARRKERAVPSFKPQISQRDTDRRTGETSANPLRLCALCDLCGSSLSCGQSSSRRRENVAFCPETRRLGRRHSETAFGRCRRENVTFCPESPRPHGGHSETACGRWADTKTWHSVPKFRHGRRDCEIGSTAGRAKTLHFVPKLRGFVEHGRLRNIAAAWWDLRNHNPLRAKNVTILPESPPPGGGAPKAGPLLDTRENVALCPETLRQSSGPAAPGRCTYSETALHNVKNSSVGRVWVSGRSIRFLGTDGAVPSTHRIRAFTLRPLCIM